MLYGCVTWSPRACHYDTLRRAHHSVLTCCIGWGNKNCPDQSISYLDTLIKTSIEVTLRRRRILFAGFVARMEDTRLPKCEMLGELVGARSAWGGGGKRVDGVSPGRPQSFRHHRRRLQPRTRGNGTGRRNKGRNVSWRNRSLQRKPGLGYYV